MWRRLSLRPLQEHRIVLGDAAYGPEVSAPQIQARPHRMWLPRPVPHPPVVQLGVARPDTDDQQQGGNQESPDDDSDGIADNDWTGWNSRSNDDWRAWNARYDANQSADSRREEHGPAKEEGAKKEEEDAKGATRPRLRISTIYCRPPDLRI